MEDETSGWKIWLPLIMIMLSTFMGFMTVMTGGGGEKRLERFWVKLWPLNILDTVFPNCWIKVGFLEMVTVGTGSWTRSVGMTGLFCCSSTPP